MPSIWQKVVRRCAPLAVGGITLGILQSFSLINWAYFFTNLVSSLVALIIRVLGGSVATTTLFGGTGSSVLG